jgi:Domain of unknown function (DUF4388)
MTWPPAWATADSRVWEVSIEGAEGEGRQIYSVRGATAATNHEVGQRPGSHDGEPGLQGTLEVLGLLALLRWLRSVERDGRVSLDSGGWSGEICLRRGRVVAASFGKERGRAALEAILLVLPRARFVFTEAAIADGRDDDLGLSVDDLELPDTTVLDLGLDPWDVSPSTVPVRRVQVGDTEGSQAGADVVLPMGTLHTFLAVDGVRSIEQISRGEQVARVLLDLATLSGLGLVALDGQGDQTGVTEEAD